MYKLYTLWIKTAHLKNDTFLRLWSIHQLPLVESFSKIVKIIPSAPFPHFSLCRIYYTTRRDSRARPPFWEKQYTSKKGGRREKTCQHNSLRQNEKVIKSGAVLFSFCYYCCTLSHLWRANANWHKPFYYLQLFATPLQFSAIVAALILFYIS